MMEQEICRKCGTPRLSSAGYCVTCGTKFPKDVQYVRASALARSHSAAEDPSSPPAPPDAEATEATAPPRRRGRIALAVAALLALVAGGLVFFSGGKTPAPAYALQFSKAKAGDTYRYHMVMDMDANVGSTQLGVSEPVKGTVDMVMGMRVVEVDGGGVATVDVSMEEGTATFEGGRESIPSQTFRMRIAPDGRLLSVNGSPLSSATSGLGIPGSDQLTPLLPDRTVKPGESWSKNVDLPAPFGEGTIGLAVNGEFIGYQEIDGVQAAEMKTDSVVPLDLTLNLRDLAPFLGATGDAEELTGEMTMGGSVRSIQTSLVDLPTGRWYRTVGDITFDVTMRMSGLPAGLEATEATMQFAGTMRMKLEDVSAKAAA
jgi:hypothetical protein